jgi:hypothetical protein
MENNYSEFKKHGEITAKINRKRNEQFNWYKK